MMGEKNNSRTLIVCVASSGAFGGAVSFIVPYLAPDFGTPSDTWLAFPGSMFVGAVVAVIGVFIVFNTDRNDLIRLIGLGLACGVLWQPTLQAAQKLLFGVKEKSQDLKLAADITAVAKSIPAASTSSTQTANELALHLQSLNEAGAKIDQIHNAEVKEKATADFLAATERLQTTIANLPPDVAKRNLDQLNRLRSLPVIREDPKQSIMLEKQIDKIR